MILNSLISSVLNSGVGLVTGLPLYIGTKSLKSFSNSNNSPSLKFSGILKLHSKIVELSFLPSGLLMGNSVLKPRTKEVTGDFPPPGIDVGVGIGDGVGVDGRRTDKESPLNLSLDKLIGGGFEYN